MTCTSCQSSYYLFHGNCLACTGNCATCDSYNKCTSCKLQNWGLTENCSYTCSTKCFNRECQEDNGYCIGCINGTYGPYCQQDCTVCQNSMCDLRTCTYGCKPGYYETPSTGTVCYNCPSDCKSCNNSNVCNVCNDGFYLYESTQLHVHCVQCPKAQSCKTCMRQTNIVCTTCNDGMKLDGANCKKMTSNESSCSSGCSAYCDRNGACLGSCKAGWTGEKCSDLCSSQCLRCDKNNASICEECNGDFYTATCNVQCSSSCAKMSGQPTCRLQDGYCLNGCGKAIWGPLCNKSCSEGCLDMELYQVCEKDNGTCKHGCIDGYDGDTCEKTMTTKQTEGNNSQRCTQRT